MTSPHDEPAYEGRVSGGISADILEAMRIVIPRTCFPGADLQAGIRGYPAGLLDRNRDLDKTSARASQRRRVCRHETMAARK